ncbi:Helicase associated domain protein [Streptomyces sp. AM8-1-1]|uniref:Helicase associated domain protein n=1 Tax=Streptomyces sp. AM8-1-1 TaxID=3075825 RepID=UPI0028C4F742|nr:Helicase associated domain protein [Streptomyces sp. AM8-1-1]WNO76940.1 Helicase associated domain protein [Streptomyces sp. AM8-1-1]
MLHDLPAQRLPSELWTRQRAAADCVLNDFAMGHARVQVIMPCGTGKTHLAVHIAHEVAPDSRSLTVMPTLDLLNQTARVWHTSGRPGHYFGLCSDKQTSEPVLSGVLTMTSNPARLAAAVRAADGPVSIFATYASLPKLVEAHRRHLMPRWDIAVVDEAHRTAGARTKPWAVIHDNDAVPARHRLYLTATPRIWDVNRGITTEPVASMDDTNLYGHIAYRYSLAEAIHEGRLADYRIAAPEIHDPHLHAFLVGRRRGGAHRTPQADAMRVAVAQLALLKAREEHGIRRPVVFSRSIVQSEAFAETLPETAAAIPGGHADDLWVASVHSRNSRTARRERLARFAQPPQERRKDRLAELSVLCNVRLCVEGVDFPLADSVLFADPKQSTIDIVQAIGRALRIGPGVNKISTLIVPVLFGPGQRAEDATFGTPYHLLHQVMIALKAYDEHYFRRLPTSGTRLQLPTPAFATRPARAPEIAPHLMLRIMEPEPDIWETGMACAQDFFDTHGHLSVPSNHITPDGFHLGCWLGYQRALKAAGNLSAARAAALATCNMPWAHPNNSTETFLDIAQAYAREHGHLLPKPKATYQGRPLGEWLAEQRRQATGGNLPAPYQRALKDIDRWWNPAWPHEWQRMCARARSHGKALAIPAGPLPADADTITRWLDGQVDTFPTLAKGQQAQLAALPLQHDPLAPALRRPLGSQVATHAHGLRAARRFYRHHQHLRVPADYADEHTKPRFPLGQWIADLRTSAGAGLLSREEINSVEALAMEWAPEPQYDSTPTTLPGTSTNTTDEQPPAQQPQPTHGATDPHKRGQTFWIAGREPSPPMLPDVILNGGRRMLLSMPAGGGKTMTVATAVHEAASRACLVLGPDRAYLHDVVKTWRMVSRRPLAGINIQPTRSGKVGDKLTTAGQLAGWMAQQPPGALVVARYSDARLIAESHRDHHLPPWDHLIVEEAHRTAEGICSSDHPHAVIHYDDGILAYKRVYLTATPRIPSELPGPGDNRTEITWAVDMPAQPIFGIHHPSVDRAQLVDKGLLSPYQLTRIQVPELPRNRIWRTQAIGAAHIIEQHRLRRVVAVLRDLKRAEAFACQLAIQMLDAEIRIPPQTAVRYPHNQPVIRCQRATDPMPPDLDALVLPSSAYTALELVDSLSPLLGQHHERAAQTAIIIPEPYDPDAAAPPAAPPAVLRRIAAALWAHDPAGSQ